MHSSDASDHSSAAEGLAEVVGPLPGLGAVASSLPATQRTPLADTLGSTGSISFWFQLDQTYRAGREVPAVDQPLVGIPGLFQLRFLHTREQTSLLWRWDGIERGDVSLNVQLPGLPGPSWIHFAANWDAASGIFDVFLNGTPLRAPGTVIPPWEPGEGSEVEVHLDRFALTPVVASSSLRTTDRLRQEVGSLYWGSLDGILGARSRGSLQPEWMRGALIHAHPLATPDDIAGWQLEGPGAMEFEDGWMRIFSRRPQGPQGHLVLWYPADLPDRFIAEWEMQLLKEEGLCIVFVAARGRRGEDLFASSLARRDGVFDQYIQGDIDCYHISYYPNSPVMEPGRTTSNMRKNAGFFLVDNGPIGIPIGSKEIHRITVIKDEGRVQLAVDGRVVIDFTDDGTQFGPRLTEGKLGFRQMQWTDARYRNLRIHALR
jgi:hypothetical protein